jgi:hypothetical protein
MLRPEGGLIVPHLTNGDYFPPHAFSDISWNLAGKGAHVMYSLPFQWIGEIL